MENKTKIFIGLLVVAFMAVVVWVVTTTKTEPVSPEKVEPPRFMEYEGNTIVEEKDGKKIWELTAAKAVVDTQTGQTTLETINGTFYREDGKTLTLTAKQGLFDSTQKNVHVEGDVEVVDSDGGKLTSKSLDWIDVESKLIATEDVVVTKENENMKVTGDVIEATEQFSRFNIKGNAKFYKDDMRADADEAEAWDELKKFKLKGNAKVLKGVKGDEFDIEMQNKKSEDNQ